MIDKLYAINIARVANCMTQSCYDNADKNGEILCVRVFGNVYYSPEAKALFYRKGFGGKCYDFEKAILPSLDYEFEQFKKYPFWETTICRIDRPVVVYSEEEINDIL